MNINYSEFYEMYDFFKDDADQLTLYEAVEEWLRIQYAVGEMANFRYELNLARGE